MKILVTGGAGFIGSHIVSLLIDKGHDVAVIDDLSHGQKENVHKKASFFHENINSSRLQRIFSKFKPKVVNHHAAIVSIGKSMKRPTLDQKVNVLGTINLLEAAKKAKVQKFIFASSVAVYGETKKFPIKENDLTEPISFYGISKLIAEKYIFLYKDIFSTMIFRYSNVFGPKQDASAEGGVVAIFINNLLNNKDCLIYGDGEQTRDFIFVKDAAKANLLAVKSKKNGIFNVSTKKETSILELYNLLKKKIKPSLSLRESSAELRGRHGNLCKPVFEKPRKGDIKRSILDNSRTQKVLGWQPEYSFEEGIEEAIEYFRKKRKTKNQK